jgi:uncharacterized protein
MNNTRLIWLKVGWEIFWRYIVFISIWGILLGPLIIPVHSLFKSVVNSYPLYTQLYFEFTSAATILLAAWILIRFIDKKTFVSLGFNPKYLFKDILKGLVFGSSWLFSSILILWLGRWIVFSVHGNISASFLIWTGLAMVFNTVTQEVLARSYIFQTIKIKTNSVTALIISSLLFMVYHFPAFDGTILLPINVFLAGILFGTAYYLSGNLWLPIAIHFAWNFLSGPVLGLSVSGKNLGNNSWQLFSVQRYSLFTGGTFGIEGGLVVTFTAVISIASLFVLFRLAKNKLKVK